MTASLAVASPADEIVVRRIDNPARLPILADAWDRLHDAARPGAVFRSGAWLVPWWQHFSTGKQAAIYTAWRGSELIGALPGYRVRTLLGGWQFRLLGDGVVTSDYLGAIARTEDLEAVSEAIGQELVRQESDVVLEGVAVTDPLVRVLAQEAALSGASCTVTELGPCPVLSLDVPGGYEAWLRAHPRANPGRRRKRRPLERRPGFRIARFTSEQEVADGLAILWHLHRLRWEAEGGSAALDGPHVERFHAESGRELARRGWAAVYVLYVEGEARAARYVFEREGRLADYQSGRDPAWQKLSVGSVLLDVVIEDAFARGLRELDFLRGDEPFKALYTSERREMVEVRVAASARARAASVTGRGWRTALRTVPRALPDEARVWLRHRRARLRGWLSSRNG